MRVISLPYLCNTATTHSQEQFHTAQTIYSDILMSLDLTHPCFLMSGDDSTRSDIDIYTGNPISCWDYSIDGGSDTSAPDYWYASLKSYLATHMPAQADPESSVYPEHLAIGFLSYPQANTDAVASPAAHVAVYNWYLHVSHSQQTCTLILPQDASETTLSTAQIALLQTKCIEAAQIGKNYTNHYNKANKQAPFSLMAPFKPRTKHANYVSQFNTIKQYLAAGDVYQINLTHAFSAPYTGDVYQAYRTLFPIAKAPYSAFISMGDTRILSFSPEEFIQVRNGVVTTSPIKGTRARKLDPIEDAAIAEQLLTHEKDRAENVMIVDLLRNDLGKVCQTGSVKVDKLLALESYSNVHHLVSTISGTLKDEIGALEALAACFPGGSITGAPKKRAMEIIDELEETPRQVYCGAIICLDSFGDLRSNIPIRTILAHQQSGITKSDNASSTNSTSENSGTLTCWSGGGIVYDSNVEAEYQETLDKINHLINSLSK